MKEDLSKYGFRPGFNWETRFILKTRVGKYEISTVDLGIDHSFGIGEPLYYETMIFTNDDKQNPFEYYQERYSTQAEAEDGHKLTVKMVEEYLKGGNNDKDDYEFYNKQDKDELIIMCISRDNKLNILEEENKLLKEQLGKLLGLNEDELWLEYNKEVINLQKENIEFEERIDKAINLFYEKCRISQNENYTFNEVDYKELLEILKGE